MEIEVSLTTVSSAYIVIKKLKDIQSTLVVLTIDMRCIVDNSIMDCSNTEKEERSLSTSLASLSLQPSDVQMDIETIKKKHRELEFQITVLIPQIKQNLEAAVKKLNLLELQNKELQKQNNNLTRELKQVRRHAGRIYDYMEYNRINMISYKEKEVASIGFKCATLMAKVNKYTRRYQDSEEQRVKAKDTREKTQKLLNDSIEMVKNMESNGDGEEEIKAMDNAIKVLQEKNKRSIFDEERHTVASNEAKYAWDRDKREFSKLAEHIGEIGIILDELKKMKNITFNIRYPAWSYSDGQATASLIESNNVMIRQLIDIKLGDDEMELLAASLLKNTNLTMIELAGDVITNKGLMEVVSRLFHTTSLARCAKCNHTCQVKVKHQQPHQDQRFRCINKFNNSSTNRATKLFTLLIDTNQGFYDKECLNNITIKSIPRLLDLARHFSEDSRELAKVYYELSNSEHDKHTRWKHRIPKRNKPLTCMFEMLREWGVPLLCA